jgi:hypothetical protein
MELHGSLAWMLVACLVLLVERAEGMVLFEGVSQIEGNFAFR